MVIATIKQTDKTLGVIPNKDKPEYKIYMKNQIEKIIKENEYEKSFNYINNTIIPLIFWFDFITTSVISWFYFTLFASTFLMSTVTLQVAC